VWAKHGEGRKRGKAGQPQEGVGPKNTTALHEKNKKRRKNKRYEEGKEKDLGARGEGGAMWTTPDLGLGKRS